MDALDHPCNAFAWPRMLRMSRSSVKALMPDSTHYSSWGTGPEDLDDPRAFEAAVKVPSRPTRRATRQYRACPPTRQYRARPRSGSGS